jgi:type I restriction enzyme, R subunit
VRRLLSQLGCVIVRGQMGSRAKGKRADYVLYHKPNFPIAVVEAKDNRHSIGAGIQQAQGYADLLDVPFIFISSNGDGFLFHDRTGLFPQVEQELTNEQFPNPSKLWDKYQQWKGYKPEETELITQDYYEDGSGKSPRYYRIIE